MATGELKLFMEIWGERPHRCFITDKRIPQPSPSVFAHVLGKGGYPKYRLEKFNIVLMLPDIHHLQHSLGKSDLITRFPKFEEFFDMQDELRAQYNSQHLKKYNTF
jgi:hypothetical protein